MAILGIVNYYQTLQIIEEKIERGSMADLKQSSYIVDSFVDKLYKLSSELSLNQRVDDFLNTNLENARDLNLVAREVMLDLRGYTILYDFIGDVYVYSIINNVIVSPTGLYTPDIFFKSVYVDTYDQTDYDEWLDFIGQPKLRNFKTVAIASNHRGTTEKILFMDSLPNARENFGLVMLFMNKEKYIEAFSNVIKDYNGNCYILDERDQVIISDGSQRYDDSLVTNLKSNSAATTIFTPSGKALMVHISSSNNKWKYVSIIPYGAFTKEINSLKISTISIISIFVGIAFLASLFATNKNYKPIKNIISAIKTTYGYGDDELDDYKVISNILESSYEEIELTREMLKNHIPMIRQSHLVKFLMRSREMEKNESDSFNTLFDIHLDFAASTVALFSIKRIGKGGDEHTEKELCKIALRTAIEELAGTNCMVYTVELNNDIIACIYGLDDANAVNMEKNIFVLAMKLKEFLENKLDILLYAGIGNTHNGYRDLSSSYGEADEALNYAVLMNEDVMCYKDIQKSSNLFVFSIQKELQLANYLKSGKQEEAIEIINGLYNENCNNKELPYEMMRFFIYDLYCSIIKVIGELKLDNNETIIDSIKELVNHNIGVKDISFFLLDIKRIVIYTCKTVNDQRKNTSTNLKNKIVDYVDKNFQDCQISLERIADEFSITPQYLSRFFKEHFNTNYVDYVNQMKVESAKKYLLNSEKVKDAAVKSGFNNIGTFINVFKKHTGFTPGEYKETNG